jgi:hypothetical protein
MIFLPTIKVDGITPILGMGETPETGVGDDVQTLDMRAPPPKDERGLQIPISACKARRVWQARSGSRTEFEAASYRMMQRGRDEWQNEY